MSYIITIFNKEAMYIKYFYMDFIWCTIGTIGMGLIPLIRKSPFFTMETMITFFLIVIPVITSQQFIARSIQEEREENMLEHLIAFGVSKWGFVIGKLILPIITSLFFSILAYLEFKFLVIPHLNISSLNTSIIIILGDIIGIYSACITFMVVLMTDNIKHNIIISWLIILFTCIPVVNCFNKASGNSIFAFGIIAMLSICTAYICVKLLQTQKVIKTI